MRQFLRMVILIAPLILLSNSEAQMLFGGDVVFDPTNFAKNTITAAQMLKQVEQMVLQVKNSDAEVQMMLQNLIAVDGGRYDYWRYANLIREVLATVNGGVPMHYGIDGIDGYQIGVYPGYSLNTQWPGKFNYEVLANTAINSQRGSLNTVHEELSPADDDRVSGVMDSLRGNTEGAFGAKDLAQTQAYAADLQLYELRRQRKMLGALTQAVALRNEHDLNLDAWTWAAENEFLDEGRFDAQPYTGAGGIGLISLGGFDN